MKQGKGKQAELRNHLDKLGASIDRFDIALDMFERLHDGARKMVESMERRERAWHETGAAEEIAGR